jgi:hypothetical protein
VAKKLIESIELHENLDLDTYQLYTAPVPNFFFPNWTSTPSPNETTTISQGSLNNTNQDSRLNVKDLSYSKLKTGEKSLKRTHMRHSDSLETETGTFMSDHTTKAILTLFMLVCILTGIILFLVFSAKKRMKAEAMLYKSNIQMDTRYGDASLFAGYIDHSNLGAPLNNPANLNYQSRHLIYQLNNMPRISDNSMAHLLLNTSLAAGK